jgi:hypothetical protein
MDPSEHITFAYVNIPMRSDLLTTLCRHDLLAAFSLISTMSGLSSSDFTELLTRGYFSSAM